MQDLTDLSEIEIELDLVKMGKLLKVNPPTITKILKKFKEEW